MVFTNSECIGCNKCIRSCPAELANVAEGERIEVNADACISCGGCFVLQAGFRLMQVEKMLEDIMWYTWNNDN